MGRGGGGSGERPASMSRIIEVGEPCTTVAIVLFASRWSSELRRKTTSGARDESSRACSFFARRNLLRPNGLNWCDNQHHPSLMEEARGSRLPR